MISATSLKLMAANMAADVDTQYVMIPSKKKWAIQIEGCYDLLYPFINVDYPTRDEIMIYISRMFTQHNMSKYNISGNPVVDEVGAFPMITQYKSFRGRKIKVKLGSIINSIGYGL